MVESSHLFASHCVASLRFALHRFAYGGKFTPIRFALVEKVHPLWSCEIWQGHTKKCVVGDTKTHCGFVKNTLSTAKDNS
jgi:hypothetical protein